MVYCYYTIMYHNPFLFVLPPCYDKQSKLLLTVFVTRVPVVLLTNRNLFTGTIATTIITAVGLIMILATVATAYCPRYYRGQIN